MLVGNLLDAPGQRAVGAAKPDSTAITTAAGCALWRTQSNRLERYTSERDTITAQNEKRYSNAGRSSTIRWTTSAKAMSLSVRPGDPNEPVWLAWALIRRAAWTLEDSLAELRELARTAGVEVVAEISQHLKPTEPRYLHRQGQSERALKDVCETARLRPGHFR